MRLRSASATKRTWRTSPFWIALASTESRSTSAVIGASLAGQLAQLVSGVASARLLGPSLRGQLALLNIVPGVASQVAHLGVPSAVVLFTAREPGRYRAIARSGIRAVVASAVLGGIVAAVVIAALGAAEGATAVIVVATILLVPAYAIQSVALASIQGRRLFHVFNMQRTLPVVFNAAGLVVLLLVHIPSIPLAFLILLVSQGIGTALSVVSAGALADEGTQKDLRALLRFGLKALPATLSPIETFRLDQLIVGIALGTTALGFYAAATAFSVLPRWIAQSVAATAYPYVVSKQTKQEMVRTARTFILATMGILVVITVCLEITVPILTSLFFGQEFSPAVSVARVLVLGAGLMSCRRIVAECSRALGRPELDSLSEISSWPVLAVGLLLLVTPLGATGVAASVAGAYAVSTVVAVALLINAVHTGNIASASAATTDGLTVSAVPPAE